MEIILPIKPKKKARITRDKEKGGGIIRIDEEACQLIEGILNKLKNETSVKQLASVLIKAAADNAIIKEVEEE